MFKRELKVNFKSFIIWVLILIVFEKSIAFAIVSICFGFSIGMCSSSSSLDTSLSSTYSVILLLITELTSLDFSPINSSTETQNMFASSGSFEISGILFPLSQFDTA